ncbi:MAG: hypothetical protein ACHQFW_08515 [Chitinophagales bacterium]
MTKGKVLDTLSTLPDEFETEELIQKLLFLEKVEKGIDDYNNDRVSKFEDVKATYEEKWRKLK